MVGDDADLNNWAFWKPSDGGIATNFAAHEALDLCAPLCAPLRNERESGCTVSKGQKGDVSLTEGS